MRASRKHRIAGSILFTAGLAIMVMAVVTGNILQTDITVHGIDNYLSRNGAAGWALYFLFAFGFPGGLAVSVTGLQAASEDNITRILSLGILLGLACIIPVITPKLTGTEQSADFFGISGYLLMLIIVLAMWYWSVHRSLVDKGLHPGTDLQGAGYACFAMAAWNLCGIGGMPSYALDPEYMLTAGTRYFASAQMKAVMILLVLGWLLTLIAYRVSIRHLRDPANHDVPARTGNPENG